MQKGVWGLRGQLEDYDFLSACAEIWLWVKTNGTILGGAPLILVYFGGDWDVHWGVAGFLTHGHLF